MELIPLEKSFEYECMLRVCESPASRTLSKKRERMMLVNLDNTTQTKSALRD